MRKIMSSITFFDKNLFFELSSKKLFYGRDNLKIFVGGLKNTVFQICSFPLQEWCIIYRRTYLRQKYGDMLEKGVPPCRVAKTLGTLGTEFQEGKTFRRKIIRRWGCEFLKFAIPFFTSQIRSFYMVTDIQIIEKIISYFICSNIMHINISNFR